MQAAAYILAGVFVVLGFTAFTGAPYVPSKRRELRAAFTALYPLGPHDTLVDMGSGDGVVLRAARAHGAVAVGYELSPLLVAVSRLLARGDSHQNIYARSYWRSAFPDATTVVYTFGDGRDIAKMYGKVEREATRLGRTLSFITYGFAVPGRTAAKTHGAFFLYTVRPCSGGKP